MARDGPVRVLSIGLFVAVNAALLGITGYGMISLPAYPGFGFAWSEEGGRIIAGQLHERDTAFRAGIRTGDAIAGLDGISPLSAAHLELLLLNRSPGDTVTLHVVQDDMIVPTNVPLVTRHRLGLLVVTTILGILFWGVAVFVYAKRPGELGARVCAWTMILMGSTIMMVWPGYPRNGGILGYAAPLVYLASYAMIPFGIVLFFLVYPQRKALPRPAPFILFIPAAVFAALISVDYLGALTNRSPERYSRYLVHYGYFRLYLVIYVFLGLVALLHSRLRAATRADRHKVQWILGGIVVGAFPFVALWSIPQALGHAPLVTEELAYVFMMLIPVAFAFSIVRYHALDIEVVVSRGIGYAVVSGLIVAVYLSVAGLTGVALHSSVTRGGRAILVGCTLLAALAFAPLYRCVQDIVDRVFYRARYTYRLAMEGIRPALECASTSGDVMQILRERALCTIPMTALAIGSRDPATGTVTVAEDEARGGGGHDLAALLQELPAVSCASHPAPPAMRARGVETVLPIESKGLILGFVAAGRRLSGTPLTDDDIELLLAMAEEAFMAAERLRLQEAVVIEKAEAARLAQLNRLKSEFIAHVSHELRTPLTSIRWSVENLLDGIPEPTGPRVREYLVGVQESASRLGRMIENLLHATRVEAGHLELFREPLTVCDALRAALDVVRPVAEKKAIALQATCPKDLWIAGDQHGIQTILINLLDNAVKYSPGGTTVMVEAARADRDEGGAGTPEVAVVVRDQGIGIPSERLDSIFEPFARVRSETAPPEQGLGLGLHIVRQLVEQHSGRITVTSAPGRGTTFVVVLPGLNPVQPVSTGDHGASTGDS